MPTVSAADLCHKNFHIDIGQWKWAVPPLCLELWNLRGRESGKQPRLQTNGRRWWRQSFGERKINHSWIEESACRLIKKKSGRGWSGLVWFSPDRRPWVPRSADKVKSRIQSARLAPITLKVQRSIWCPGERHDHVRFAEWNWK